MALLACCSSLRAAVPQPASLALADFAVPQTLDAWDFRQVDGAWLKDGAVRLIYPRWSRWRGKWPSARLYLPSDQADWTPYNELRFTVANRGAVPALVKLRLDDGSGTRAIRLFGIAAGGERVCQVSISHLARELDVQRLVRFDLYMSQPVTTYPLILGPIELLRLPASLEPVSLFADPFGGGDVEISGRLDRWQSWRLALEDDRGVVDSAAGDGYEVRWRPAADLAPGNYRVTARADTAGEASMATLGTFSVSPPDRRESLAAWYEPATEKVLHCHRPAAGGAYFGWSRIAAGEAPVLSLDVARNEEEGAQVVFLARVDSLALQLAVEPLRHQESGVRFAGSVRIFQVGYVNTRKPDEYPVEHVGWWPDPLLAADSLIAIGSECAPVWLSVRTEPETDPGVYIGGLRVVLASGATGTLPLQVRVHAAQVPREHTVRTAFSLYDHALDRLYGGQIGPEVYGRYVDLITAHRLNLDHLYRRQPPDLDLIQQLVGAGRLNAFNLWYLKAEEMGTTEQLEQVAAQLEPYVAELRRRGLVDRAYLYGFDEVQLDQFGRLAQAFAFFKDRFPDVKTMTTAVDPGYGVVTGLGAVVDIWVPLIPAYDRSQAARARAAGDEVWWYVAHTPFYPYANWLVESAALEARLLWWMSHGWEVDGFLYYAVNRWPRQRELLRRERGNRTNWDPASFRTNNGAGDLLYAGPDGPVTTIRLENIRDGIEELELLRLVPPAAAADLVAEVASSRTDFLRNPDRFADVRRRLLEAASR